MPIAPRPQAFAVLRYLVLHADRLVTKAELLLARVGRAAGHRTRELRGVYSRHSRRVRRYGSHPTVSGHSGPAGVSVPAGAGSAIFRAELVQGGGTASVITWRSCAIEPS